MVDIALADEIQKGERAQNSRDPLSSTPRKAS